MNKLMRPLKAYSELMSAKQSKYLSINVYGM